MDILLDPTIWASLATLTALEVVLGIDNIIFISIVVARLPEERRQVARRIGLGLALGMRIVLLAGIAWIVGLTQPVLTLADLDLSWRDIILFGGGLFLLVKGTREIHDTVEGEHGDDEGAAHATFGAVIAQIVVLDLVFSLDSVITAVGMAEQLEIMVTAVVIAMGVMLLAADAVAGFIERHPTTKMLALAFLILVGMALVADGLHFHIPRGYLYFAIAFSIGVESLNLWASARRRRRRAAAAD